MRFAQREPRRFAAIVSLFLAAAVSGQDGTVAPQTADPQPEVMSASGLSQLGLPDPDLSGLEGAVAEQLHSIRKEVVTSYLEERQLTPQLVEAIGVLGQHYHSYDLRSEARSFYELAAEYAPADFRWPYLLAYLDQTDGDLEQAQRGYEKALLLDPDVTPAWIRLGHVLHDRGELEQGERAFRNALRIDSTSAAALAGLGGVLGDLGKVPAAIEVLEHALNVAPEADRLYYPLAQLYQNSGQADLAAKTLAKVGAIGVRPSDPIVDGLENLKTGERAHLLLGRMAFNAGDFEAAAEAFLRAVEAAPASIRAKVNLAAALTPLGQVNRAIQLLEEAVALGPGNATALFNLALLLEDQGDLEGAAERLKSAVSYAANDIEMIYRLAQVSERLDRVDDALAAYERIIQLSPELPFAHVGRAQALLDAGQYAEAGVALETAHEGFPDSGLVTHALARFLAAVPLLEMRDGSRALQLAQVVFQSNPFWRHAETVAFALAETGDCATAAEWTAALLEETEIPASDLEVLRATHRKFSAGPPCNLD